jgi:hypothetical protein
MLPALREAIGELRAEKQHLDELRRRLRNLTPAMRGNGHAEESQELDEQIRQQIVVLRAGLEAIGDAGVLVKDIDMGIVDFPSMRAGRIVYLCWTISEPDITHWHEVDDGFDGRRPL